MSKVKYLLFGAILLSILVVLPAIAACAPKAAPKEKVISYLGLADFTGPGAGLSGPANTGSSDMFKEINEKGGIDGVKVNTVFVDTRYDVSRGVSAYKRYRTEPNLLMVNPCSTAQSMAILPMTLKDKVVQFAPADGAAQAHIGWAFTWGVIYQNAFGATIDFILEDWKAKGKTGTPVIGYINWDNPHGQEPLRGGKEYAEKMGVKLLPPEFFPSGTPDHTVWLQRLAVGGPNYILTGGTDPTPSNILRDAYRMGLTKTIQFIDVCFWGPTEAVGIKLHPEATEGAWVVSFYLRGDECWNHPLAAYMVPKYCGKSVAEARKTLPGVYVSGIVWTLVYQAGAKGALDDVGYEKVDGEAMKKALESLTGVDIGQGLVGPCAYSPTNRQAYDVVKFYAVKGGKEVPISDWRKVPDAVSLYDWSK